MLKQYPKIETIHTLFLLERLPHMEQTGKSVKKWQSSWPFWLQVAMVLLLAFFLSAPKWIQPLKEYRVAIVLDDSASMSAFKTQIQKWTQEAESPLKRVTHQTQWYVLSSLDSGKVYYQGDRIASWSETLESWAPSAGPHSLSASFEMAHQLVGDQGSVLYLTDHQIDVPDDVILVSVGSVIENVGIHGVEVVQAQDANEWQWSAVLKNSSSQSMERTWKLSGAEPDQTQFGEVQKVTLEAGASVKIGGKLPKEIERAWIELSGDAFPLDDRAPIQQPRHAALNVLVLKDASVEDRKSTLPEVLGKISYVSFLKEDDTMPQLTLAPLGIQVKSDAIQFGSPDSTSGVTGSWYTVEKHFLTRDLSFMGLMTNVPPRLATASADQVLVWKQDRPLILLRQEEGKVRLVLNWSLESSNYRYNPDVMVLLYRFTEWVSKRSLLPISKNFEIRQKDIYPVGQGMLLQVGDKEEVFLGKAPESVGFFEVKSEEGKVLVKGATQFGDVRESDFSEASEASDAWNGLEQKLTQENVSSGIHYGLLGSLVLGLLVLSWMLAKPSTLRFKPESIRAEVKGGKA